MRNCKSIVSKLQGDSDARNHIHMVWYAIHGPGARVTRTAKLVRGANDMANRFHNPALADANGAKAYVDAQWNETTVKQRYDWIFEYDATSVAI